jgi:hypothetical protein
MQSNISITHLQIIINLSTKSLEYAGIDTPAKL